MNYELYNTDTEQVEDTRFLADQDATNANILFKKLDSPQRWIKQVGLAPDDCMCGAEMKFECVCNEVEY